MRTSSILTATAGRRARKISNRSAQLKTAPRVNREPFSLPGKQTKLRFCRRPSRCRLPHWRLLWRPLLFRNVLFLYFGLVPVQKKRRIGIVGGQGPREVDRAVFFNACRRGLTDYLHIHVGRSRFFKFIVARYEGNFKQDGIGTGHDLDYFARHFRKLQPASRQPSQFTLVATRL